MNLLLTRFPINFLSRVNMSSGIIANGIPNDRNTWLKTSAREGSKLAAMTISAGTIVIARRRNTEILRRMKPCITTWPASVPTDDDEMPEARSAMPKMTPLRAPR